MLETGVIIWQSSASVELNTLNTNCGESVFIVINIGLNFSGVQCEIEDYCITNPCTRAAVDCIVDPEQGRRICICADGLKGDDCTIGKLRYPVNPFKDTYIITSSDHYLPISNPSAYFGIMCHCLLKYQHIIISIYLTDDPPVTCRAENLTVYLDRPPVNREICLPKSNDTTPTETCYNPDEGITYRIESDLSQITINEATDKYCVSVSATNPTEPVLCVSSSGFSWLN